MRTMMNGPLAYVYDVHVASWLQQQQYQQRRPKTKFRKPEELRATLVPCVDGVVSVWEKHRAEQFGVVRLPKLET